MSGGRSRPLPLRARRLSPAAICAALSIVIVLTAPHAMLFVGPGGYAPRGVGPLEYGPMLTGVALALGLAPRLYDWDRFGAPRTRVFAVSALLATVLVPLVLFGLLVAVSPEAVTVAERRDELALASNVVVASLSAALLIGVLGRLVGTLAWAVASGGTFMIQAVGPSWQDMLPFTLTITADGGLDTRPRWVWIVLLGVAGIAWAWFRRSAPIEALVRRS